MKKLILYVNLILWSGAYLNANDVNTIINKYYTYVSFPFYIDALSVKQIIESKNLTDKQIMKFNHEYYNTLSKDCEKIYIDVDSLDYVKIPLVWFKVPKNNFSVICTLNKYKKTNLQITSLIVYDSAGNYISGIFECYIKDDKKTKLFEFFSSNEVYRLDYEIDSNNRYLKGIQKYRFTREGLSHDNFFHEGNTLNILPSYKFNDFSISTSTDCFLDQFILIGNKLNIDSIWVNNFNYSIDMYDIFPNFPDSYSVYYYFYINRKECQLTENKIYPIGEIMNNDNIKICIYIVNSKCENKNVYIINYMTIKDDKLWQIANIVPPFTDEIISFRVEAIDKYKIKYELNGKHKTIILGSHH